MNESNSSYSSRGPQEAAQFALNDEQTRFFAENGYLRIDQLTTPQEASEMRDILKELFERRAGEKEGAFADLVAGAEHQDEMSSPQILNPANYAPKLRKTHCFQNALGLARQLLGEEARCFFDLTILKQPHVGAATPWHQDEAFRDPNFEYRELTVWVALQDVAKEGGCLQFVPKSHLRPVLEHHSVNGDRTAQALEVASEIDASSAVVCELPLGGCSVHHHRTLHHAAPNSSDVPRYTYIMTFGVTPKSVVQDRSFPWLSEKAMPIQDRKRHWMRRGGLVITAWRRLRQGDLVSWQTIYYGLKRSAKILSRGI